VSGGGGGPAGHFEGGRQLGNSMQDDLDELLYEDANFVCPITLMLIFDPVIASDGCVYERIAIERLVRLRGLSPVTHKRLDATILPVGETKGQITALVRDRATKLESFITRAKKSGETVLAKNALERLKEYVSFLKSAGVDASCSQLCRELGVPEPSSNPMARIEEVLDDMVMKAKEEAEMALMDEDPHAEPEKNVIICLDVSGSMGGARIESAKQNMLKIYDQYINDGDQLSFVAFNHQANVIFPMTTIQGNNRNTWREAASRACKAGGGTAFYDALINASAMMKSADKDMPRWIIALTDGADQHSKNTLEKALGDMKAAGLDLVIVGVELRDNVQAPCEKLATASDKSVFINATDLNALDEAFEAVAELICD
jgi:Mg-chelatase subunit ChlD